MSKIGIDEAGRGPLAGPLSLSAVKLVGELELDKEQFVFLKGEPFRDSKKLSVKKREALFDAMQKSDKVIYVNILKSAKEIDERGLKSILEESVKDLLLKIKATEKDEVLLDGALRAPSKYNWKSIKKGDEKVLEIALASIFAKVIRDKYMERLSKKYPDYEFEKHKGYGTKKHQELILKHGPSPEHRKSFLKNICK